MFHLERAALCGELEAIVALGQCYLQLPHHILPDMEVEVSRWEFGFWPPVMGWSSDVFGLFVGRTTPETG